MPNFREILHSIQEIFNVSNVLKYSLMLATILLCTDKQTKYCENKTRVLIKILGARKDYGAKILLVELQTKAQKPSLLLL